MVISKVDWALQFARLNAAPIDASQTIDTLVNLRAALNAPKSKYYAGQLVSVTGDTTDNNGLYRVTGTTGSLNVTRVDPKVPIVECKTHDEEHGDTFKWARLYKGETASLSLPGTVLGDKVYIGLVGGAQGTDIDVERPAIDDTITYATTGSDIVTPIGEVTLEADGESFVFTNQGNETQEVIVDTTVFITTDKVYYDWLCGEHNLHYGIAESGFDDDYGTELVNYYYVQHDAKMFYVPLGRSFNTETFDTPVIVVLTGDKGDYPTFNDFYSGLNDFYTIPLGSSTGDSGGSVGSAFNFVGEIASFPTDYATGDMWYISSDFTKPSGITLVGKAGLGEGDFLVCLNAESNTFTVLQGDVSVEIPDVPSAYTFAPGKPTINGSSGTSNTYARGDHKHPHPTYSGTVSVKTGDGAVNLYDRADIYPHINLFAGEESKHEATINNFLAEYGQNAIGRIHSIELTPITNGPTICTFVVHDPNDLLLNVENIWMMDFDGYNKKCTGIRQETSSTDKIVFFGGGYFDTMESYSFKEPFVARITTVSSGKKIIIIPLYGWSDESINEFSGYVEPMIGDTLYSGDGLVKYVMTGYDDSYLPLWQKETFVTG